MAIGLTLMGLVFALSMAMESDRNHGVLQDDDITHFFFACYGWNNAVAVWQDWARPGYSLPTTLVAHFGGMTGCRIFSCLQTAAIAYLAYRIALLLMRPLVAPPRELTPRSVVLAISPAFAPLLVWAQPMAMQLAQTSLTETPAALYLTLGVFLYLRGNRFWGCVAVSPCFISRTETVALAPLFVIAIVYDALKERLVPALSSAPKVAAKARIGSVGDLKTAYSFARRNLWPFGAILALAWAPLMWIIVAQSFLPHSLTPLAALDKSFTTQYGRGTVYHFARGWLLEAGGAGVLAAAAAGAIALGRRALLPTAIAVGLAGLQTVIFMRGDAESGGYMRFLVPICGVVGAVAACGLGFLLAGAHRLAISAAILVIAAWILCGSLGLEFRYWETAGNRWAVRQPDYAFTEAFRPLLDSQRLSRLARIGENDDLLWVEDLSGGVVIAMLIMAALAATLHNRWASLSLAWATVALGAYLGYVQFSVQVHPLRMGTDDMQLSAMEAVEAVQSRPDLARRPAITGYAAVKFLRPETYLIGDYTEGVALWAKARPGTLYFWENKYGYRPEGNDPNSQLYADLTKMGLRPLGGDVWGPLHEELVRHGRQVVPRAYHGDQAYAGIVEVYERLDDATAGDVSPASGATTSPSGLNDQQRTAAP
ncbi:MAG: hypothetical protein ACE15C_21755 [Phycisphaerae bacterium]